MEHLRDQEECFLRRSRRLFGDELEELDRELYVDHGGRPGAGDGRFLALVGTAVKRARNLNRDVVNSVA